MKIPVIIVVATVLGAALAQYAQAPRRAPGAAKPGVQSPAGKTPAKAAARETEPPAAPFEPGPPPRFQDIAIRAGLNFRLENSLTAERHQIETMPGGVAVLDYNNDGLMDLYFVNGGESPTLERHGEKFWNRLYRNNGDGTFADVTASAGVPGAGYMMGAAAADFDNDGYPDLFVAGVRQSILYHNNGNGTFTDISSKAALDRPDPKYGHMWAIHGAWVDYDGDGWLDLFVVNYCRWDPDKEPYCGNRNAGTRAFCHPKFYAPLPNQLFHNNHDGTFSDVSAVSGIAKSLGKGMGAAVADYDGDGRPDIFVANDTEFNFLFHNLGSGKFEEVGMPAGVGCNVSGRIGSSMGADFRDIDNDGRPDLFVTDLSQEGFLLFRGQDDGDFDDIADRSRVTRLSLPYSGWSDAIVDLNNDGAKDLFSANGHAMDNIEIVETVAKFREHNAIFQQTAPRVFRDVSLEAGADFQRPAAHRGAAIVDFNNDGWPDIVTSSLGERPELFRNVPRDGAHWLLVNLVGGARSPAHSAKASNRQGLGAIVKVVTDNGRTLWNHATTSVGFASSSDPRVHFGLGASKMLQSLEVLWPSGRKQFLSDVTADRILTVKEPESVPD